MTAKSLRSDKLNLVLPLLYFPDITSKLPGFNPPVALLKEGKSIALIVELSPFSLSSFIFVIISGNLSSKRGQIEGMEERGVNKAIKAKVPLSELFGYVTELRGMTQGRANPTMEFSHYEVVPKNVEAEIIKSRQ